MVTGDMLDVVVGIVLVYLLLGLCCMTATEAIARLLRARSRTLFVAIRRMLEGGARVRHGDQRLAPSVGVEALYAHPLILGLEEPRSPGRPRPAHIPPRLFALALLDLIAPVDVRRPHGMAEIRAAATQLPEPLRRPMLLLIDEAAGDLAALRAGIERWFDDVMARTSATYRRWAQSVAVAVAFGLTLLTNADTLALARSLAASSALRGAAVAIATSLPRAALPIPASQAIALLDSLVTRGLPVGWSASTAGAGVAAHAGGLLITTLAVSLGAPFWFAVLEGLAGVRAAANPSSIRRGRPREE
ncbi:MAG: hypothetical protein M3068_02130 [Gemmatimonadota bacterium]|nr:hypothetical protein [Gemmatimonadota bacterium]